MYIFRWPCWPLILSAFNNAEGRIYRVELTASYHRGGFTTYANFARAKAQGKDWSSSQFLFAPADLAYVHSHWIALDHDQSLTASFGASYCWTGRKGDTRVYVDALFGRGLRTDAPAADGSTIPNGGTVPLPYAVSVGAERTFKVGYGNFGKPASTS